MLTFLAISVFLIVGINLFIRQPKFGKLPEGERKARIEKSPNFKDGAFKNLNFTPQMTGEGGFIKIMKDMFNAKNRRPARYFLNRSHRFYNQSYFGCDYSDSRRNTVDAEFPLSLFRRCGLCGLFFNFNTIYFSSKCNKTLIKVYIIY